MLDLENYNQQNIEKYKEYLVQALKFQDEKIQKMQETAFDGDEKKSKALFKAFALRKRIFNVIKDLDREINYFEKLKKKKENPSKNGKKLEPNFTPLIETKANLNKSSDFKLINDKKLKNDINQLLKKNNTSKNSLNFLR